MSDDSGMQKKFSYPNSRTISLRFLRSSFLISPEKVLEKLLILVRQLKTIYTPLRFSSWPNSYFLYLLIVNITAMWCKQYVTSHMTSKLSVNMAYFCTNFVIIMQLSFVRQGWCFPTYFPKFFLKSFQISFENAHFPNIFLGRSF